MKIPQNVEISSRIGLLVFCCDKSLELLVKDIRKPITYYNTSSDHSLQLNNLYNNIKMSHT